MQTRSRRIAASLAVATGVLTVATLVLAIVAERAPAEPSVGEWIVVCFAPGFMLSGWWLTARRPRLSLGWLFLFAGLSVSGAALAAAWAAAAVAQGWPGVDWGLWVFSWLWQPHGTLLWLAFLMFPDGAVRGRWHRGLIGILIGVTGLSIVLSVIAPGPIVTTPDKLDGALPGVVNPIGIDALSSFADAISGPLLAANLLAGLIPLGWTAWWWARSADTRSRQFRWATIVQLVGLVAPVLVFAIPGPVGALLAIGQTLAAQLLVCYAILQWRAYEVDVVVRRSVLAVSFLTVGLGIYAIAVLLVSSVSSSSDETLPQWIGAAIAIFAFGPMSTIIRRGVNRLFFGRRDDPYAVISGLSRELAAASNPTAGIQAIVTALTAQLRLPYAAVHDNANDVIAESGHVELDDEPVEQPLLHQGEVVGTLRVGHRRGDVSMTAAEADLLTTLSDRLGAAVAARQLIDGLREAQTRLVAARDEERRRIQRDLHDGLGSRLTAVTLKLDAAGNYLDSGDATAGREWVTDARADVHRSIADLRRLVYSLGDPTLTALGLTAAINEQVDALTRTTPVRAEVRIGQLPVLPAAVEETIFRVVLEAVTNVVRHAAAVRCEVSIVATGAQIVAEVRDDGRGIDGQRAGVGRSAMLERANGIGGSLTVGTNGGVGTTVTLCVPVGVTP